MNMIKDEIKDKVFCVWFNTWQYSQFQMNDELSISLLTSLVESLIVDKEKAKTIKNVGYSWKVIKGATVMAAGLVARGGPADATERLIASETKEERNIAKALCELKNQFQKCINVLTKPYLFPVRIVLCIYPCDRL